MNEIDQFLLDTLLSDTIIKKKLRRKLKSKMARLKTKTTQHKVQRQEQEVEDGIREEDMAREYLANQRRQYEQQQMANEQQQMVKKQRRQQQQLAQQQQQLSQQELLARDLLHQQRVRHQCEQELKQAQQRELLQQQQHLQQQQLLQLQQQQRLQQQRDRLQREQLCRPPPPYPPGQMSTGRQVDNATYMSSPMPYSTTLTASYTSTQPALPPTISIPEYPPVLSIPDPITLAGPVPSRPVILQERLTTLNPPIPRLTRAPLRPRSTNQVLAQQVSLIPGLPHPVPITMRDPRVSCPNYVIGLLEKLTPDHRTIAPGTSLPRSLPNYDHEIKVTSASETNPAGRYSKNDKVVNFTQEVEALPLQLDVEKMTIHEVNAHYQIARDLLFGVHLGHIAFKQGKEKLGRSRTAEWVWKQNNTMTNPTDPCGSRLNPYHKKDAPVDKRIRPSGLKYDKQLYHRSLEWARQLKIKHVQLKCRKRREVNERRLQVLRADTRYHRRPIKPFRVYPKYPEFRLNIGQEERPKDLPDCRYTHANVDPLTWDTFRRTFQEECTRLNLSHRQAQFSLFMCLRGDAAERTRDLLQCQEDPDCSIHDLLDVMETRFDAIGSKAEKIRAFVTAEQYPKETLCDWYLRAQRLYLNTNEGHNEEVLLTQFVTGIRRHTIARQLLRRELKRDLTGYSRTLDLALRNGLLEHVIDDDSEEEAEELIRYESEEEKECILEEVSDSSKDTDAQDTPPNSNTGSDIRAPSTGSTGPSKLQSSVSSRTDPWPKENEILEDEESIVDDCQEVVPSEDGEESPLIINEDDETLLPPSEKVEEGPLSDFGPPSKKIRTEKIWTVPPPEAVDPEDSKNPGRSRELKIKIKRLTATILSQHKAQGTATPVTMSGAVPPPSEVESPSGSKRPSLLRTYRHRLPSGPDGSDPNTEEIKNTKTID